jgi:hypothetical protein
LKVKEEAMKRKLLSPILAVYTICEEEDKP